AAETPGDHLPRRLRRPGGGHLPPPQLPRREGGEEGRRISMIAHLTGKILSVSGDSLVLDVGGVGYEVFLSAGHLEKLKTLSNRETVSVLIYTSVREDHITLFGFSNAREKQLFLRLISVSGIGPKLALNILSGIASDDLIDAIHREDLVRLTSVSGIGKKTAERM